MGSRPSTPPLAPIALRREEAADRRHRPFRTREKRLRYTTAEGACFEIPLRKLLRLARSPEAIRLTEERVDEWRSGRVSCRDAL